MRKKRSIGKCIYCKTSAGKLTDEHIVPYGLNGEWELLQASCEDCQKITTKFERRVLADTFRAARAALNLKSYRGKKNRNRSYPLLIKKDGQWQQIELAFPESLKIIPLPGFKPPAFLDNRPYVEGVQYEHIDYLQIGETAEKIAQKLDVDDVGIDLHFFLPFARLIGKIAYGMAVLKFGLDGIDESFLLPAIMGQSNDIGRWVGCMKNEILPQSDCLYSTFVTIKDGLIFTHIKLFPAFNDKEYIAVVGRASDKIRGLLHGLGYTGS